MVICMRKIETASVEDRSDTILDRIRSQSHFQALSIFGKRQPTAIFDCAVA